MIPLVSILIPAYNAEKWISDTIMSALCQSWPKKELIIVDDGSTDRTLSIARKHESNIVKIVSQENMGACVARNRALEYAQGDYIQWLDADDLLHSEKISNQIKVSECDKSSRELLTSSFGTFFFQTQKADFRPTLLWQDLTPVEWLFAKVDDNVWMNPTTWLVSRKLIELAGPWDNRFALNDDGEYICRIVSKCNRIKFVPEAKCYYRIGNINSLSKTIDMSNEELESYLLSKVMEGRYLLNMENSDRTRSACIKQLQRSYIYYYPERHELTKKANDFAKDLGGVLLPPDMKLKYRIIQKTFGWGLAKRAYFVLPRGKLLLRKNWQKLLMFVS